MLEILLTIAIPFGVGLLALLVHPRSPTWAGVLALLAPLGVSLLGIWMWAHPPAEPHVEGVPWLPSLGIHFSFALTRLGNFFVLLIGLIGLGVVQYSRHYLGAHASGGFWALLLGFMGAMLGIVLADDLIVLYVFWELTTVTSALLIGWEPGHEGRRGAVQAFLVTGSGGLAMLAGFILLGQLTGTFSLTSLASMGPALVEDRRHTVPLALILLGAFTKSAQVPFHFWLPGAMAAPSPVSAYLHSATMVNAGVYLVGRLFPVFSRSEIWLPVLAGVGVTSYVVASWRALRSFDVKRLLAYSTVAYLGLLFAQYGYAARTGFHDELLNLFNHATYKSGLFLLAGWVERFTGTRDLRELRPERWVYRSPVAAGLFAVGVLAMAGFPMLLGFLSKELFFTAILDVHDATLVAALPLAVLGSALGFAFSLRILADIFWGEIRPDTRVQGNVVSRWLLVVPAFLLVPQVVGGIAPRWALSAILDPESSVPGGPAVWHALDMLFVASIATYAAGALLFALRWQLARVRRLPGVDQLADVLVRTALRGANLAGRAHQAGGHPRYLAVIVTFALVGLSAGLVWRSGLPDPLPLSWGPTPVIGWLPALAVIPSALGVALLPRRVPKAIMAAVAGYGVALFYVAFRGPDLALTQLLVETATLVLLLFVSANRPRLTPEERSRPTRVVHGAVSLLAGASVAWLAWSAGTFPAVGRAGEDQLSLSLPAGGGHNAVNVILVDIRGTDTLGEITVIAIAALGGIALFRSGAAWEGRG